MINFLSKFTLNKATVKIAFGVLYQLVKAFVFHKTFGSAKGIVELVSTLFTFNVDNVDV